MNVKQCPACRKYMRWSTVTSGSHQRSLWLCAVCPYGEDPALKHSSHEPLLGGISGVRDSPVRDLREHEEQKMISNYQARMQQKRLLEAME